MTIALIVGLGNPGPEYQHTRHNAGAWWVEALAAQQNVNLRYEAKFHGVYGIIRQADADCHLLIPTTFMNRSGQAVQTVAHYYKISAAQILVAHDELDLPVGAAKLKFGGGHAGHNGLRDIMERLGTADFYRLRLGIGRSPHKDDTINYVLKAPSVAEKQSIEVAIEESLSLFPELVRGEFDKAMQRLHTNG